MIKYLPIGLLFCLPFAARSQENLTIIKDTNYQYTDTINKKVYYGDYVPTGLIKASDGKCIISTQFSIFFSEFTDSELLKKAPKAYAGNVKTYYPRIHTSSGSIFKLNKLDKKDWEIAFREQRVKQIVNYDDTSFIAAGERTDQKNIWVARINSGTGKTIWFKEFVAKRNPGIERLSIALNKDIIILSESKRIIPLSIRKNYGRIRFVFFKEPENMAQKAMILSISGSNGLLNWKRNLGISKKYDLFDEGLAADSIISMFCTRSNEKSKNEFSDLNFVLSMNGEKLLRQAPNTNGLYLTNINGWVYSRKSSDTIYLTWYDGKMNEMSNITIQTPLHYTSLETLNLIDNYYYLFGATDIKKVMLCKFDSSFHLLNSITYKTKEMITDAKLSLSPDGYIMVVGKVFKNQNNMQKPYQYINLLEFDLNK